ncbi:hypothetical protein OYT88_02210 [Sporolactobacillus sp. CQH2019]|uniref:hypothetical protein n=1 Tax=Sporolactobacillus sp. CQH2019 TaxID=3023512 RepID=UPI0023685935|nr:hypothetical protein [Sporolactobacillus sp. CQH2019]MDD9147363.1 hypothetical protein [Sporolactobacillus sp. CQH2019]
MDDEKAKLKGTNSNELHNPAKVTDFRLRYLDSLLACQAENIDGVSVGDSIDKLIKKLNSTLINEK